MTPLSIALMLLGRTGHPIEDFEERAEAFYRDTGVMAPGKSVPVAMGGQWTDEERHDKFDAWWLAKKQEVRAVWRELEASRCDSCAEWFPRAEVNTVSHRSLCRGCEERE